MFDYLLHLFRVIEHYIREHTKGQSQYWKVCRNDFLEQYPRCAACGGTKHLAVHHIEPFFADSSKEVNFTNLITLCAHKDCHRNIGHGGAGYTYYNPHVRLDAEVVLAQPALRPIVEQRAYDNRLYRDPLA